MRDIEALRNRDEKIIRRIYEQFREPFLAFASKYGLRNDEVSDIYQEAFVALIENAQKGNLDTLKSNLKTYLFSIGKYMIFRILDVRKSQLMIVDALPDNFVYEPEETVETNLLEVIRQLEKPCDDILRMFYYEEKKLEEITTLLDYKSKDVTKSQKSRCLNKLRQKLKQYNE